MYRIVGGYLLKSLCYFMAHEHSSRAVSYTHLRNIRQAKNTRADAKTSGNKTVRTRPPKKGGFFAGLKTDAPQTVQQLSLIHI